MPYKNRATYLRKQRGVAGVCILVFEIGGVSGVKRLTPELCARAFRRAYASPLAQGKYAYSGTNLVETHVHKLAY